MMKYVNYINNPIFPSVTMPNLVYISKVEANEFKATPRVAHKHEDSFEMIFIVKGTGQLFIGGKEYNVKKGDLVLYNCGVLHDEKPEYNTSIDHYGLAVSNLSIPSLPKNHLIPDTASPVIPCSDIYDFIEQSFSTLYNTIYNNIKESDIICYNLMVTLISIAYERKQPLTENNDLDTNILDICSRTRSFINENYSKQLTLQSISSAMCLSPYYLAHIFKMATGYSPMRYVSRLRLGTAQVLLIHSGLSITEIAYSTGFNNLSNFNYAFLKLTSVSPSEFRKKYSIRSNEKRQLNAINAINMGRIRKKSAGPGNQR